VDLKHYERLLGSGPLAVLDLHVNPSKPCDQSLLTDLTSKQQYQCSMCGVHSMLSAATQAVSQAISKGLASVLHVHEDSRKYLCPASALHCLDQGLGQPESLSVVAADTTGCICYLTVGTR
jgi:hypothetical protein